MVLLTDQTIIYLVVLNNLALFTSLNFESVATKVIRTFAFAKISDHFGPKLRKTLGNPPSAILPAALSKNRHNILAEGSFKVLQHAFRLPVLRQSVNV